MVTGGVVWQHNEAHERENSHELVGTQREDKGGKKWPLEIDTPLTAVERITCRWILYEKRIESKPFWQ